MSPELAESRPMQVLERSLENGRLAHAILISGDRPDALDEVAQSIAARLLETERPARHPDFFVVRPANKLRRIRVEDVREVNRSVQQSSNQGGRKVVVFHDADRLAKESANAFLKTLEEPPAGTTILLLSTRPYSLLPTIRSRCMLVNLPPAAEKISGETWRAWIADYQNLLHTAANIRQAGKNAGTECIMMIYGLTSRLTAFISEQSATAWKTEKETLPEGLSDEQLDALEVGVKKGFRTRLLAEIEEATRGYALEHFRGARTSRHLARSVAALESSAGLLEVNLQEGAAIERFLLETLRIWSEA